MRYPAASKSAPSGQGLLQLAGAVSAALSRDFADVDIETGVDNGRLMAHCRAHGEVLSQRFTEERVMIHCRIVRAHLGRIVDSVTKITPHQQVLAAQSNGKAN